MNEERWLPVVGYERWYEVSNLGRIRRSAPGMATHIGRIRKQSRTWRGYMYVKLCKDGVKSSSMRIHRIVARSFIGKCPYGKEVNHKDGNKENNSLSNLEYVTNAENARHAAINGLRARGEEHCCAKLTEKKVLSIREEAKITTRRALAEKYHVCIGTIGVVCRRESWAWLK